MLFYAIIPTLFLCSLLICYSRYIFNVFYSCSINRFGSSVCPPAWMVLHHPGPTHTLTVLSTTNFLCDINHDVTDPVFCMEPSPEVPHAEGLGTGCIQPRLYT